MITFGRTGPEDEATKGRTELFFPLCMCDWHAEEGDRRKEGGKGRKIDMAGEQWTQLDKGRKWNLKLAGPSVEYYGDPGVKLAIRDDLQAGVET